MTSYLIRRLVHGALLVFGLLTAVFFLVHAMPGDPASLIAEPQLGDAGRDLVRQRLGLDQSLAHQYQRWLVGALHGDFGTSLRQQRPVIDILRGALPNTLLLTVTAFCLELGVGLFVGVSGAMYPRRKRTRVFGAGGLVLYSLPSFWLGLVAIMVFARYLGWFPVGGMHAPDAQWLGTVPRWLDVGRHLVLPALVLGLGNYIVAARFARASLGRILASDWVLAARARGVPERRLVWRHALRVAALPVITWIGFSLPRLIGGAVAVEEIFAWPGLGRVAIQALLARDYPVIMAVTSLVAVLVTVGSLLADLLARWADPRLRFDHTAEDVR